MIYIYVCEQKNNHLHGAESFLRSWQSLSYSINCSSFKELKIH
jgi:hypothetical protein